MRGSIEGVRPRQFLDVPGFYPGDQHPGRDGSAGLARDPARNSQA